MKFTTGLAVASLASTGLAAHRGRHARFHDSKREMEALEMHTKRAIDADPSLAKRCGEMINTTYTDGSPMSFPNCFLACASDPACSSGAAAPAAAQPASSAPASSPAASPAPASTQQSEPSAAPVANVKVADHATAPTSAVGKAQQGSSTSAAPASSSSASSSSGSGSSSSSDGFVGLAYNSASLITGDWLKASWAYNWGYTSGGLNSKIEYVPMFHKPADSDGFKSAGFSGSGPLLSLNEPDKTYAEGGCDMSAAAACTAHKDAFSGYTGHKISSPAVSSQQGDNNKGLPWLKQFHSSCSDAQVDFVALHWYGGGGTGEDQGKDFMKYVDTAIAAVDEMWKGKPIWFTEFAAVPITDAQVNADFLDYVLPLLKKNNRVERVAPFMVGAQGALGTDSPNAAGQALIKAA